MKKLLIIILSISLGTRIVNAQDISGNYQLDSLSVKYVVVVRDMVQTGSDGNQYTCALDSALSSYGLWVGWPNASDTSHFDYELPAFSVGDTVTTIDVHLPYAIMLTGAEISMKAVPIRQHKLLIVSPQR